MKHNLLRRAGALLLALALVMPMAVTTAWADPGDKFVSLPASMELTVGGDAQTLTASVTGTEGGTVAYSWSSNNPAIASVMDENSSATSVSPVKEGTATITVTATWTEDPAPAGPDPDPDPNAPTTRDAVRTATASCDVTVKYVNLVSLSPKNQPKPMKTGETQQLEVVYIPANASDKTVSWSVTPAGIVTVDQNGLVTAHKEGTATVTARGSGTTARTSFTVVVTDAATPEVIVTPEQENIPTPLTIGETFPFRAQVTPADAKVEWGSSSTSIATVDGNGLVTCLRAGTAIITCTATGTNNKRTEVRRTIVVVDPKNMIATSLTAKSPTVLSLSGGEPYQLEVNVVPAAAQVTWTSDNTAIATVDPATGKVTGVTPGKANITATAQKADGSLLTVKFEITVTAPATGINFISTDPNIRQDKDTGRYYTQFNYSDTRSRSVAVEVTPKNTNTYIVWSSNNTALVTVGTGTTTRTDLSLPITRVSGKATVTATVYDNTTKQPVLKADGKPMCAELDVVVSGIAFDTTSMTLFEGESKTISIVGPYGEADSTANLTYNWDSTDNSIVSPEGSGAGASLNAWNKGSATITATTRDGKYSARCTVTVIEDPGSIVSAGSASAGNAVKVGTSSVISQINAAARQRTGTNMDYITGIFISPSQGVVYNTYTSEADTGSGVSMSEKYYVNRPTPATEYIGALSFVPAKTFSGEARITYMGYSAGQSISGVISVKVTGMGESGSDVTYTSAAAPVTFQAEDFNIICGNKTGRTLKYVTFTPPQSSVGTLYENYVNDAHPGQKVVASTQYNRTGSPSLNSVTFVPAQGYSGTVKIAYRAVDAANTTYTGTVTINVDKAAGTSDPADIYYAAPKDGWVTFRAADFANASLRTIGETLSHVRFSLPNSSDGTLFYNYRGFGNYDDTVVSTTSYYQSGTPSLGAVTFVPATTAEGQTAIAYTGYSTRGTTFTGTVYVGEGTWSSQPGTGTGTYYDYTVNSGSSVNLNAAAFNNAFRAAMGVDLSYIRFNSLPTSAQGTLRYRTGNSTYYNNVSTSNQFYRIGSSSSALLIGNISFLANPSYTGVLRIPYTGYDASGRSYPGEITIQVTPNTIYYTGTTASPMRLSASRISGACGAFTKQLSYIEFTSLPGTDAGRMYFNYSGYGTGSQITTGVKYYASGAPRIDQLSFVPKGRYTGDATATYTAYSASGEKMTGQIVFRISAATGSSYFTDMYSHSWAAASVDYLYQNNVTQGMTATTFGPSLQIRRGDFVLMLYRAFRFSGGNANNPGFADVPVGAYYAQAVSAAKQMGIANGDGVNFMPNSPITRQDAMVMIKNAMVAAGKLQGGASSTAILNNFPDGASVSSYARDAVSTLVQMGAVNGSNGMLNPRYSITRAEAAVILHFVMTA